MIELSVICNVLESYEVVRRQLLHLNRILTAECEFILVDDGSVPSLESIFGSVTKHFPFQFLATQDYRPWTQPRARNLGAKLAQARKLLFFDIDHILTESLIHNCLACSGDKLHWVRRPGVLDEIGYIVTDRETLLDYGLTDETPSIHGNSFMIRRSVFELLHGYDERYCGRYGGDDVDFNDRYRELCAVGQARPEELCDGGFVYPNPALDCKRIFHRLRNPPQ